MSETFGYVRVSSMEQNENRQLDAMRRAGIPPGRIYIDKQSGKDFARPAYRRMSEQLSDGDLVCVMSIDRLGRNYEEIKEQWRILTKERGVDICVLDMPILDTRRGKDLLGTFMSDIVLQILSFVAENERENIRKRQEQGIAAAKARGRKFGRPRKNITDAQLAVLRRYESGALTAVRAQKLLAVSESTFYRYLREYREE